MDKTYAPEAIEHACYQTWESHDYFSPRGTGTSYCMMLPPPNVTGTLHMGHGFQDTLMDAMIRYQRMSGKKTLWQPGVDHAGISTQLVVEKQLQAENLSRKEMGREAFLKRVWQWKEESGNTITKQMRHMGCSVDWSKTRFTMDEGFSKAVNKVFIQLHDEGLIYRGNRLVNWDPKLGTAVSDLEVITEEEAGFLWHIKYPIVDSEQFVTIATTRPETLLGDAAIAVHPEDKRYQKLIGKHVHLPLCERTIPIIADEYVEQDFGSGCVKITPAHDFNDYEVGKRHDLPQHTILTKKGSINRHAPLAYQGMDRFVAREKIIEDLKKADLLEKIEPHQLNIPRGEKSNAIIEPLLTDQWYVHMEPLAKPAIDAVKNNKVRFMPEHWTKTYNHWMENIEDWCISRQLWWGHRIPAWYDNQGHIYVGYSEKDVRFKHKLADDLVLKQDEDVLDTWFSSSLWPFVTLGWPEKTPDFKTFFPTQSLITGFDILFFWVARMIMMSLKFTGKVPFSDVFVTGLIADHEGKKMSKSKGNVLDPMDIINGIELKDLIEKRSANHLLQSTQKRIIDSTKKEFPEGIPAFGTDALRFAYCALATNARTIRFDMARVEGYRNFCNKLWNATRYVLMHTETENGDLEDGAFQYSHADHWIFSRMQHTIARCHQYYAQYRFDLLANTLYDFVWHEYCDWYLELSKPVLYDTQALSAMKRGTRRTLVSVLFHIVKMLHPIMPFITETIFQRLNKLTSEGGNTVMLACFPEVEENAINLPLEAEMAWLQSIIQSIRTIRSEMGISPAKYIPLYFRQATPESRAKLEKYNITLTKLAKIEKIHLLEPDAPVPVSASAMVEELELLIPMAGLIQKDDELARLEKSLKKLNEDISRAGNKLNNPKFTAKAPADVIEKEQGKLEQAEREREKLLHHQAKIEAL
ncbi:MAG: valine--tRNA ligase [Gammaproteobacteria bacterium]|nr:valine--tRNA ligase [Gammaproteobacteria bacterium]